MSKTLISLLVILFLVVAGAGLWWFGGFNFLAPMFNLSDTTEEPQEVEQQAPTPQSELTTGSDSSDQALAEDSAALDAELEAYGEISSALDQGFEDEPVEQDTSF
ncbi:MAG: hypothetical protein Q8P58_03010 [Candidatus Adlerbacteria bacterium]|nr:hypothetical protein [Candidatus Adlerbacteria bacterium]